MSTFASAVIPTRSGFKALLRRHPLLTLYAIMFVLAWSVMVPQALAAQGRVNFQVPVIFEFLIGWAPGIAAVITAALLSGKAGVRELISRFRIWRVGAGWYGVALFLLAGIILGGIGLHVLFGGAVPAIPAAGAPLWNIALSFLLLIVVGSLFNTEEIAWRGFALPRLQARYTPLAAGVLLAIPEVLLHLPLFWSQDNLFYQTVGIYWFSAFSVAAVFIYIFVFNRTRGSLLIVTLLHASQNAWANLLSDNSLRPFTFTVALAWMLALGIILLTRGQLGYPSDRS